MSEPKMPQLRKTMYGKISAELFCKYKLFHALERVALARNFNCIWNLKWKAILGQAVRYEWSLYIQRSVYWIPAIGLFVKCLLLTTLTLTWPWENLHGKAIPIPTGNHLGLSMGTRTLGGKLIPVPKLANSTTAGGRLTWKIPINWPRSWWSVLSIVSTTQSKS